MNKLVSISPFTPQFKQELEQIIEELFSRDANKFKGLSYSVITKQKDKFLSLRNCKYYFFISYFCSYINILLIFKGTSLEDFQEKLFGIKNANYSEKNYFKLEDYCPWLIRFRASNLDYDIEIPGQYSGDKRPLVQYHVKISTFLQQVCILRLKKINHHEGVYLEL